METITREWLRQTGWVPEGANYLKYRLPAIDANHEYCVLYIDNCGEPGGDDGGFKVGISQSSIIESESHVLITSKIFVLKKDLEWLLFAFGVALPSVSCEKCGHPKPSRADCPMCFPQRDSKPKMEPCPKCGGSRPVGGDCWACQQRALGRSPYTD